MNGRCIFFSPQREVERGREVEVAGVNAEVNSRTEEEEEVVAVLHAAAGGRQCDQIFSEKLRQMAEKIASNTSFPKKVISF